MKIKTILIIITVFFSFNSYGQISLTSENNTPKPECQYNYISVDFDFASYKFVGEDTIWSIQNITVNTDTLSRTFTRDSSFISFPGYNFNPEFCPNPSPEDTSILRTENAIFKLSTTEIFQAYEVIFPPNFSGIDDYIGETYMPFLKFPFQYNDSIDAGSKTWSWEATFRSRNTWKIADAWGSLLINDTIYNNTLRVYTYYNYYSCLSHDIYELTSHKYEWYSQDYQLPILSLEFEEDYWIFDGDYTQTFDTTAWLYHSKNYVSPTSIDLFEFNSKKLDIFPIPAKTRVFLKSNQVITGIRIVDLMGKSVLTNNKHQLSEINVSSLSNGVYILYVHFDDGTYLSKKLIVTK